MNLVSSVVLVIGVGLGAVGMLAMSAAAVGSALVDLAGDVRSSRHHRRPTVKASGSLTFSAIRIAAAIDVELTGLNLGRPPAPHIAAALHDLVDQHHVIVVRDQFLDACQLQRVAESLGPTVFSPVQRAIGSTTAVSVIEDTAERPPAGFGWHTDLSRTREPPALGSLNAVTIPPYGGDPLWASTAAIFDDLSEADRQRCGELTTLHASDSSLLAFIELHHGDLVADRLRAQNPPVEHALTRAHPTTGRHETSTCHRVLADHHPRRRVMRRCVTA